ncbi:helix-turn-helix domain-containing protein [Dactylosporangium sp. CS-047395]|uniref:helix-turn-helix domain-containing protein n=1 Tax=Dactylosporangium sp. CS-047395 TaxID=3239936 RepID=UPI003D92EB2D
MGTVEVLRGAVAERVRHNIKQIRQDRKLTGAQLAELLGALGRPMQPTAVNKIETGARRVDVDDVVAFALALNTTPNRLLLNDPADGHEEIEVAPHVVATASQAWTWANGQQVLLRSSVAMGRADATFDDLQRDFLRHAQPPAQHPAQEAVDDLRSRLGGFLGWVEEYAIKQQREVRAGEARSEISLDHLIIAAEELRQSLKRLEGQIIHIMEDSPLADEPEYGLAFFASVEVHRAAASRVSMARDHADLAQAAHTSQEKMVYIAKEAHVAALERLAAVVGSGDADIVARLQAEVARCLSDVERAQLALANARDSAATARQDLERAQRELYELRRMMLIRKMVPPQLPPALAYIDTIHPTDDHAAQVRQLWERLNRSRLLELPAKLPLSDEANPGSGS